MGEFFHIFNIDKGLFTSSLGKWAEFFHDGHAATDTTSLLSSKGNIKFPKDPLEGQPYKALRKRKSSKYVPDISVVLVALIYSACRIGICDLPFELQDAIFALFRDPVDVLAFCLTASHFWRVGLPHFKALYTRHVLDSQAWGGDRLICMGEYTCNYPEGLLTESELKNLKASYRRYFPHSEDALISDILIKCSHSYHSVRWPTSYDFAKRCRLTKRPPEMKRRMIASSALSSDSDDDLPIPIALYQYDFSAWFERSPFLKSYNREKPCVLRNLSKHVYIRDDALAVTERDTADSSFLHGMSFGDVILSRILWSESLDISTTQSDDSYRGIWAGDRLDIVNIDAVENDEGWTDVSVGAFEDLRDIWESYYGELWVEELRNHRR